MQIFAKSPEEYISQLPEDRQAPMMRLRQVILDNLPEGFAEVMQYGMIGYCVPLSLYPAGYLANPQEPLPFLGLASQKQYIALYHMAIYASPELSDWLTGEYARRVKGKMDMGKSCLRLKKMSEIPYDLIGELCRKVSIADHIALIESATAK